MSSKTKNNIKIVINKNDLLHVKKATLLIFALTIFANFCYSQESQKSDTNEVTIHLVDKTERDLLELEIEIVLRIAKYRNQMTMSEHPCFSQSHVTRSDDYITLKSDISWEVGNPPEQPRFFLFKYLFNRKSEAVQNEIEYLKFASKWDDTRELPYAMIDKLYSDMIVIDENGKKFCYVEYKFEPDSLGEMKLQNNVVKIYEDSIKGNEIEKPVDTSENELPRKE